MAVELATRPLSVAIARPGRGFGRPRAIGTRSSGFVPAGVAVQPDGHVVALYTRPTGIVGAAVSDRGRAFSPHRTLASIGPIGAPSLAVDPRDGVVVVAYATRAVPGGPNQQAVVATLRPGETRFFGPVVLTDTGIDGEAVPEASAGPGGVAVAIQIMGRDPQMLQVTRRGSDGIWPAPKPTAAIGTAGGTTFPTGFSAVPLAGGVTASAWLLGLDEDPDTGPARLQAFAQAGPPAGLAVAPFTAANRRLSALSLAAAGDEAFAATASPGGPVILATLAHGAVRFTPRTLSRTGDGDAVLAAGGAHVLAAYQRGDRVRLATVR